jgi:hypothetical protein
LEGFIVFKGLCTTTDETTSHLTKLANYANQVIGYTLADTALKIVSKSSCTKCTLHLRHVTSEARRLREQMQAALPAPDAAQHRVRAATFSPIFALSQLRSLRCAEALFSLYGLQFLRF